MRAPGLITAGIIWRGQYRQPFLRLTSMVDFWHHSAVQTIPFLPRDAPNYYYSGSP